MIATLHRPTDHRAALELLLPSGGASATATPTPARSATAVRPPPPSPSASHAPTHAPTAKPTPALTPVPGVPSDDPVPPPVNAGTTVTDWGTILDTAPKS